MKAERSALLFFLLVLALAAPLWLVSDRLGVIGALRIPVSDLALAFTPMLVALGLTAWRSGLGGAAGLLRRAFDPTSIRGARWVAATSLLPPASYLASWGLMRLSGADHAIPPLEGLRLALLLALFLLLAAGEEVGWMGYAFEPLQKRFGPFGASLIIAVPWWAGHLPSMAAIGVSPGDMAWWMLGALGLRVIMTWLYNGAGASLFAIVLFHALLNLSRIAVFPSVGAHYVGAYQAVAYLLVGAVAAAIFLATRGRLGWKPGQTLGAESDSATGRA